MSPLSASLLGLLQALTEFLPVSSSGHLVLARAAFEIEGAGLAFDVALHLGTLASVLYFFRSTLRALIVQSLDISAWRSGLLGHLSLATLPAVVAGLSLKDWIELRCANPTSVGLCLLFTGVVLLRWGRGGETEGRTLSQAGALLIGCAQALALLPGISRAGSTICAALALGLSREEAFRFSFLLSIPVIAGAGFLQGIELLDTPPPREALQGMLIGATVAAAAGFMVLEVLRRLVIGGLFSRFGYYCFAIGALALLTLR